MPLTASLRTDRADLRNNADEDRLDRSGIRALSRAIEVLRALEDCPEGLTLREIGRAISLPRSTVQRIVETLSKEGFLIAVTPNAKVRLGPALLQLAANMDFDIKQILRPFLRDLGSETRETIDLSVHSGGSVVLIDQLIGTHGLIAISPVGERLPLHRTANGKVILAFMSPSDARRGVAHSLREHGCGPDYDENRLWRDLETIRSEMVSIDREEAQPGVSAISTAVNVSSIGLFAISIRVPSQRLRHGEANLVKKLLEHGGHIISKLS